MGGGDLNSKKSWHPNTLKNQELVWKAEQKAAQEKKMITELQRERAQERDRAELSEMAKRSSAAAAASDDRLSWMYDKPDKKVQQEDYLLGKAVDSNFEQSGRSEQDGIPAVSRRVVGSSMLDPGAGDSQVDLARKMREDPLLLIKERERAARAALLQNPMQRRKLTELLRKEQDQHKVKKEKKSKKKDDDLDDQLAAKLNALCGGKGINLAALLESGDSSSSESSDDESPKKKKKPKKAKSKRSKSKKKKKDTSDNDDSSASNEKLGKSKSKYKLNQTDKRKSMLSSDDEETVKRRRGHNDDNARESPRIDRPADWSRQDGRGRERSQAEAQRYWRQTTSEGARQKQGYPSPSIERSEKHRPRGRGSPETKRSPKRFRNTDSPTSDRGSAMRHRSPRDKQFRTDIYQMRNRSPNISSRSPKRNRSPNISSRSPKRNRSPNISSRSPKRNRSPNISSRSPKRNRSPNISSRSPKRNRSPNISSRSPKRNRSPNISSRSPKRNRSPNISSRSPKRNRSPNISSRSPKRNRSPNISSRSPKRNDRSKPAKGLSEAEKAARLKEMASAGAAHEKERGERVARQRVASAAEEAGAGARARAGAGGRGAARELPASLETRIHSNRHNIQRNERHMNENFARR